MNTARRGNGAENAVAREAEEMGGLVGSRRHIGGAGDLLIVWPDKPAWLVEVKKTLSPYSHFVPADRRAMSETAARYGIEAFLAWRNCGKTKWLKEAEWPQASSTSS